MCTGGAQTEGVFTVCEKSWAPTLQDQGQDPHLRLASPGLPQRLWHRHALWFSSAKRRIGIWERAGEHQI